MPAKCVDVDRSLFSTESISWSERKIADAPNLVGFGKVLASTSLLPLAEDKFPEPLLQLPSHVIRYTASTATLFLGLVRPLIHVVQRK